MEIHEAIIKKGDLETAIERLVMNFEKETKLKVTSIEQERIIRNDGGKGDIVVKNIKIKVEL